MAYNQSIGGDGFMALAPVAHEDHARRAVLAALGIQGAMRERKQELGPGGAELSVRIGIRPVLSLWVPSVTIFERTTLLLVIPRIWLPAYNSMLIPEQF